MIPAQVIAAWRTTHPWINDRQVEQDLILTRLAVEIAGHPELRDRLVWRGGTCLHKIVMPERPDEEGSRYTNYQCTQTARISIYFYNAACTVCGEIPADHWFILGSTWFSWGVNDGDEDEMVWGIEDETTPLFYLPSFSAERGYVHTVWDQDSLECRSELDDEIRDGRASGSDQVGNAAPGAPWWDGFWSGSQYMGLGQSTKWYTASCLGYEGPIFNRLQRAHLYGTVCFRSWPCKDYSHYLDNSADYEANYREDITHRVVASFGHNRSSTSWNFGCGPSFGLSPTPGIGPGCGWVPEADQSKVWEIFIEAELRG